MRICLVNPSILNDNTINSPLSTRNKYFLNPCNLQHIGLGYIAAVLREAGYETDIIECAREGLVEKEVCNVIKNGHYDAVGISTYYFNYRSAVRIVTKLKAANPSMFIFLGGFLPTLSYEKLLENLDAVDCCIIGEGEITTLEMIKKLEKGEEWQTVAGLAFKAEGDTRFTGKRALIDDLDSLPFPVRPFVSERKIVSVLTTRGCYGRCNYCGIQEFYNVCSGKKVRRRSPENVVAEIEHLVQSYAIEYITFNDGNFHIASPVGRKWFDRFYELIKGKNIYIKYLCDFRANEIVKARDVVERFQEIGLYSVNVGIESFVQKQLDFYNKGTTVEENIHAIQILEDLNLRYTMGILMFDPNMMVEDILNFVNVVKNMGFYSRDYNISRPLSIGCNVVATTGTALFDYVVKSGLYAQNENNYVFKHAETDLCFNVVKAWSAKVIPLFNKNYIVYIAEENRHQEMNNSLKGLYQRLFQVDLEVLHEICIRIIGENFSSAQDFEPMLVEWGKMLEPIEKKLTALENVLLQYY